MNNNRVKSESILKAELEKQFVATWPKVVNVICNGSDNNDISISKKWLEQVLEYNVPHGKGFRGLSTVFSYYHFCNNVSVEGLELACVMGWAIEMLQASFLVADDIMDGSETRRGQSCWYRLENVGLNAVNDAFMLEHAAYNLLRKFFKGKKYYGDLVSMVQDVVYKTTLGQSLDTQMSAETDFNKFTMDRYKAICKYKTSYYTFYLPVVSAMIMSEEKEISREIAQVENILLDIGLLFQIQDDYLDCFGDARVTGKVGTDIVEGKCSWLVVKALGRANSGERQLLMDLYKKGSAEEKQVKALYRALGMTEEFEIVERRFCEVIREEIKTLELVPQEPMSYLLDLIYKRKK